ncbi:MAG: enoyl-CoA hydratase/isomerase family protein [Gammaproteobacteria bacterium]|nr:enoyl-CoA hydratase/isomerase family protein [Gammaproteobacteria bacterium]
MEYSEYQHLLFDRKDNGVMLVTLNRPEIMNATNARLHWELTKVWDTVNEDDSVKVIVVTGAGDRAFSAGGDSSWIAEMVGNADYIQTARKEAADIVYKMLDTDKPIISAINGVAVGAGLAVALMADIPIIAEEARFTDGHVKLGVSAGDHAAIIWPLLCGMAKAKYYLMTAEFISGKEAEQMGMAAKCLPREEVLPEALRIADKLAKGSQPAIQGTKKTLNGWMRMAGPIFDHSLNVEMMCFLGSDAEEGVAAFREKREANFPSANK